MHKTSCLTTYLRYENEAQHDRVCNEEGATDEGEDEVDLTAGVTEVGYGDSQHAGQADRVHRQSDVLALWKEGTNTKSRPH